MKIHVCLLLLVTLLGKGQQVTASTNQSCNDRQYLQDTLGKCCSRCAPGTHLKTECTLTSDTECQQCEDGKYTASWNFAESCRNCRSCASHLVEKEKCSPTKKELCVCPEGYQCAQYTGVGVCLVCKSILPTTITTMSEPSVSQGSPVYPVWVVLFIVAAVVISVIAALTILYCIYIRHRRWFSEKLGCMDTVKKPLPESSGLEVIVPPDVALGLLRFPMEETDASQTAEIAVNSIPRQPI